MILQKLMDGLFFQKIASRKSISLRCRITEKYLLFHGVERFLKDTINCKWKVVLRDILYSINVVKFRMLLIFSNDFCYLYYELKMRKHGWNRMLNCAFTKNWHLRLDKFGSCQFSRNATKHIKLKMILQTMSVYPYVSVLTRQRNWHLSELTRHNPIKVSNCCQRHVLWRYTCF